MTSRFCPFCGASIIPNSTRCVSCGAVLSHATPAVCAKCGAALVPTAAFCASCGAPVGKPSEPASPSGGVGPAESTPAGVATSTPASTAADRRALSNTTSAAALGIAGFVLSIVGVVVSITVAYFGTFGTHSWNLVDLTVFGLLASLGGFGLIITLIELWLMRGAFVELARFDTLFSTPRNVTPAAMAGVVLVVAGLLSIVVYGPGTYNGVTLGLIAVVLVGACLAVTGFIALAIGVWRMGDRFDEDLFKIGAVLLAVVGIVGMVIILIAARSARRRLPTATPAVRIG